MVEGFWIVQFQGLQANGGGVATFVKGRLFGGDSGYLYEGCYELRENVIKATVRVRNFLPAVPNVLGIEGDFELLIDGKVEGNIIIGKAAPANRPGVGMVVKLTKQGDLP